MDKMNTAKDYQPYQEGRILFQTQVNAFAPDLDHSSNSLQDGETYNAVTGLLMLPKTYSPSGKKTTLVMLAHGADGYITETVWRDNNEQWLKMVDMLLEAGYAVFDTNTVKDNGNAPYKAPGMPQTVQSYYKAYRHCIDHYNLSDQIITVGCSMGGLAALNFAFAHPNAVSGVAFFAGMIDLRNQGWIRQLKSTRAHVAACLNFEKKETYEKEDYEEDKACPYDPMKKIVTIDGREYVFAPCPPLKFWHGLADTILHEIDSNRRFIHAVRNAGGIAEMREVEKAPHALARGVFTDTDGNEQTFVVEELICWMNRIAKG
ncbi:MAG: hypothetical protein E7655_02115 [Ruminococcaceae bacterium]|nr:hypothetical protein [Oscillospiraceae bacterium]